MQTSGSLRVDARRHSPASHRMNVPVYHALRADGAAAGHDTSGLTN